jgi:hypothetical protein
MFFLTGSVYASVLTGIGILTPNLRSQQRPGVHCTISEAINFSVLKHVFRSSSPCVNISQVLHAVRPLLLCFLFMAQSLLMPVHFFDSLSNWDFLSSPRFLKFPSFSPVWFVPFLFCLLFHYFYLSRLLFISCVLISSIVSPSLCFFYFPIFTLLSLFWKRKEAYEMTLLSTCAMRPS